MSIFNFFRRSKSTNIQEIPVDKSAITNYAGKPVDHTLFVEEKEPELSQVASKQVNHIEVFLNQNFEWQGSNDGYSYPETEYFETKLKQLKSDFRLAVDKCMDIKRSEVGELRMHIIKTAGLSDRLESQLAEKAKQFETNIHELDIQKVLSIENEGIVSSAVHAYRLGFIKGVEKFQKEKLFAGSTGLYN